MKKEFKFEFEDESTNNKISYDYNYEVEEEFKVSIENGVPVVYGNKSAYEFLAKAFIKMSKGDFKNGFHVHLNTDFDADEEEAIRFVLTE